MLNPDELLAKAQAEAQKIKEVEVVAEINRVLYTLKLKEVKDWDADELARAVSKLAMLNINLSEMVAEATLVANSSYAFRKFRFSKEYKALRREIDSKVKDSELEAQELISEDVEKELVTQYQADLLKGLYDSVDKFISVVQSRLKHYGNERGQSGLGN